MTDQQPLANIRACVFDAYGTLFDVHSAVGQHRHRLGDKADAVSTLWRTKQLEYTWLRSLMKHHADFWQVTGEALAFAFATHGIDDPDLYQELMNAYLALDAYPEVFDALNQLKQKGVALAILSNGSPKMLDAAVKNAGIDDLISTCLSVEAVGIFKPDPGVYKLAVDSLHLEPAQIAFQSSNAWDINGASAFGLNTAWINRFGQRPERLPGRADLEITRLSQLPDLIA